MGDPEDNNVVPMPSPGGATDERPRGGSLLAQISNAVVRLHKEHWGKGPTKARTIYSEDVVLTRLDQIFTQAESTLVQAGREDEVRAMRSAFAGELGHEFVGAIERLTGRKVQAYIAEIHPSTNMGIELFVLAPVEAAPEQAPREGFEPPT